MSKRKRVKFLRTLMFIAIIAALAVIAATAFNIINSGEQGFPPLNEADKKPSPTPDTVDDPQPDIVKPEPVPRTQPDIKINITSVGDIMFHPSQIDGAYDAMTGTYDFTNSFKAIKSLIEKADVAIGNFEGTTGSNEIYEYQGYPIFNAPDEVLDALKNAGFDVLSTANNHCLDTRKAGLVRTVQEINERGMDTVGTYEDKPETRVLMKDVEGIKLAFLSYTEMLNGMESCLTEEELDTLVNVIDRNKIAQDIRYAKDNEADVIIALIHWGDEYARQAAPRQKDLADFMFTEGVDIIFGNHPHVVQEAENMEYEGRRVFVSYAAGNFISNQRYETISYYGISGAQYTEDGLLINIEVEKKGETGQTTITSVTYTPLWVYKGMAADGRIEHVVYPIMEYMESEELTDGSKERMQRSYNDTMSQVDTGFNN